MPTSVCRHLSFWHEQVGPSTDRHDGRSLQTACQHALTLVRIVVRTSCSLGTPRMNFSDEDAQRMSLTLSICDIRGPWHVSRGSVCLSGARQRSRASADSEPADCASKSSFSFFSPELCLRRNQAGLRYHVTLFGMLSHCIPLCLRQEPEEAFGDKRLRRPRRSHRAPTVHPCFASWLRLMPSHTNLLRPSL